MPVRFLEAETATPPLDLYLINKWVAKVLFTHLKSYRVALQEQ
jgi:hypothetical protein